METSKAARARRTRTVTSYAESSASDADKVSDSDDEYLEDKEEELDEEEGNDLSRKDLAEKYSHSSKVIKNALKKLISECKAGKTIHELCTLGDEHMKKESENFHQKKRNRNKPAQIAFPTCISINSRFCSVSPASNDDRTLKDDDILKIEMGFDTDGCVASLAHTYVVAEKITGRTADVLVAAGAARDQVLRVIQPGMKKEKLLQSAIMYVMDGYQCKLLKFECQLLEKTHELLGDAAVFELNKAYTIDMAISNDDTSFEREDDADVFGVIPLNEVKATSAPMIFLTMDKEFQRRAFSVRSLEDREDPDLDAFISSRKSEFLRPYPILCTKHGVLVVRLKFTIFLTNEGPIDKTSIRLQKYSHKKGKGEKEKLQVMSYCGKVAMGSDGMGTIPAIRSISWVNKKGRHKKKMDGQKIVCTGTFGTYVFEWSRDLNETVIEDLELGWNKVSGHKCECCPFENSIVALGVIDENDRANIYLLDLCQQNVNPAPLFESLIGFGINSLSWSQDGLHLLCTFRNAKKFVVITRKRNKLTRSGFHDVEFAFPKKDNSDHFGVFHPHYLAVFIVTSTDALGAFVYEEGQQQGSATNYYRRYVSKPGNKCGFCGIAISPEGKYLFCPRFDGSILVLDLDVIALMDNHYPCYTVLFDQQFDAPTPAVSIKCSSIDYSLFAILDKGQIISTYDYVSKKPILYCDNKKDIDCTKACSDFTALSWLNELLAVGGEDGFLRFWAFSSKAATVPFAVKKRNFVSENLFYMKQQLVLGSGKSLRQNWKEMQTNREQFASNMQRELAALGSQMNALGEQSAQRADLLEQQIAKAVNLGIDKLSGLQHTGSVPVAEVRELIEEFIKVLTTVED